MTLPVPREVSAARALGVTAALAGAGALLGAVAANVVMAVAVMVVNGPGAILIEPRVYVLGAMVGGLCGLVAGPLTAWTLLRRVPLGRAFLDTTIGSAVGGGLGLAFGKAFGVWGPIGGAVVGLALAAIRLRWAYRSSATD